MSITDEGSVLILGAGASEPFGLPLGARLIDLIADQIRAERRDLTRQNDFDGRTIEYNRIWGWANSASSWYEHPLHPSVYFANWRAPSDRHSPDAAALAVRELESLLQLLQGQTAETIDAFIAENPTAAKNTKIAVASILLKSCYKPDANDRNVLRCKPFDGRELQVAHRNAGSPPEDRKWKSTERNWAHLLINLVRHAITEDAKNSPPKFKHKIRVITFNYDPVLEYILQEQFSNREMPLPHYSEYLDIVHVHGKFDDLKKEVRDPGQVALDWAQKISVVNDEDTTSEVSSAREIAKRWIRESRTVYCVGFAFSGPNCRLLGLPFDTAVDRKLVYCNWDGNVGIDASVERYCYQFARSKYSGDWQRPKGVIDFIQAGYLGEPPA